jgi:hypothetical protein
MGLIKRAFRRKVKTPLKRAARQQARKVSVKCGTCGKRYANPLAHTCAPKSDFRRRKAAPGRKAKREAARERRKAAADRRKAAAAERRRQAKAKRPAGGGRPPAHDYRLCRDEDCARHACRAYKDGLADGEQLERA